MRFNTIYRDQEHGCAKNTQKQTITTKGLSVCFPVCLSVRLSVWLILCLSVCLIPWLPVCLSCLSCLSLLLSVCLSILFKFNFYSFSVHLLYFVSVIYWGSYSASSGTRGGTKDDLPWIEWPHCVCGRQSHIQTIIKTSTFPTLKCRKYNLFNLI